MQRGDFSTAGGVAVAGIAKWNGTAWSALGSGVNGNVAALAVIGSDLYVGGGFTTAGGVTANGLAKWNGTAWSAVGGGVTGYVYALHVAGSDLYVGGQFTAAGAVPAANIAKWNGTVWSALGVGQPDRVVSAIAVSGTTVFAGLSEGDIPNQFLYRWDGTAWFYVDSNTFNGAVSTLMVHGGDLYVGGNFDGTLFRFTFDGFEDWNRDDDFGSDNDRKVAFAQGVDGAAVNALAQDGVAILAGGRFTQVYVEDPDAGVQGHTSAVNAAKIVPDVDQQDQWKRSAVVAGNGLAHSGMGPAEARVVLDEGAVVWVAGGFAFAGGKITGDSVNQAGVARWTKATRTWTAATDQELNADTVITSLARANSKLYAGGQNGNLFRLNDTDPNYLTWEHVGTANGPINALSALGTDLIVAGDFTSVDGTPAASIAKWNGSAWSALGSGITGGGSNRGVYALKAAGSDLYAGGKFAVAGGVAAVGIAKWNGTAWSAVGSAFTTNDFVYSLATLGSDLVAGGSFPGNIQKWNSTAWSALGGGLNNTVYGVHVNGSNLYAAGEFIVGAGAGAAVWNGSTWSALGTGVRVSPSGDIGGRAISADGTSVFVGGTFTTAGGIPSHSFAEYGPGAAPAIVTLIDDKFDDGNIATNTLGTGNGFLNGSQQPVTESAGYANFNNGGVSTEVIASNPLDAANPFQTNATSLTFTYGDINHTSTSVLQRLWFGYRRTGPVGFVYYPGAIGTSFGSGRQGLYVSVLSQNTPEDGYTRHGNLVATDDAGVRTTLASWTWANPAQLSGLVVKLTTTATHYHLEFSGAAGGVPTYTFGAASGLISGMGTVLPSTKFDVGGMNQYFAGPGGQARLDSVLWQRSSTAPATVAFATATPSANPVNAAGAPNLVNIELTRTGNTAEALTMQVVPGQPATTPGGFAKYVYGTDYEFVSGTAAGSTVSFAAGQTTATVSIQLKSPVLTKKGQFRLTLASLSGVNFIGNPASATVTINARDLVVPTIVINTPVAGATFDINGTVKDAGGLSAFSVKVNGVTLPITVDPVTGYINNTAAPFSALGAIAENGQNMITVTATDGSGNTAVSSRFVTYVNNRPALAGTYTAVLNPTGTPDGDVAGFVTVTVTATGATTGKLTISGATITFTGLVNNAGAVMFKPTNSTVLDLEDESEFDAYLGALTLNVSPSGLTGTLSTQATGGTTLATLSGVKTPYSSTNLVPAGLLTTGTNGVYTIAFPSKAQSPVLTASAYPQGDGFATLSLSNAGVVKVIGKLADGTPLTASGNLRADGKVALFASLYKKQGLVAGELAFANLTDSDVSGSNLLWIRPAQKTARYYRYGWENGIRIDAVGAKYIQPASLDFGQGAVDTVNGNAALVFTDGQLASTITDNVNVSPTNGAITPVPFAGAPYKLTFTAGTGVFSGTFTHGSATDKYFGVLINKGANKGGFGYFLSTVPRVYGASGESGSVSLQP